MWMNIVLDRMCYHYVHFVKNNLGKWCIRYKDVIEWNAILNMKINPETSEVAFVKTINNA